MNGMDDSRQPNHDTAEDASADISNVDNGINHNSSNERGGDPADSVVRATTTAAAAASSQLHHVTDRALRFLSQASNEVLGACLVGLGATTYLVLGRVGLLLIGMVGGIALHATWDADSSSADALGAREADARKKRETGLEVVQRVFMWRDQRQLDSSDDSDDGLRPLAAREADFSTFRPETAAALNILTNAIICDYVKWWYSPILAGEDSFPAACRQTLAAFLLSLSNHLSRKRPVDAFLDFVTNSSSIVIVFLNELAAALNASPNSAAADAVSTYLELKPDSSLASVLDSKHQEKKLNLVANDILVTYLDPKAFACPPVQTFLKQVLSKLVLSSTVNSCSKPEFINQCIVSLLEDGEPELMNAIDAGVEGSAAVASTITQKKASAGGNAAKSASEAEAARQHRRHESRSKAEEAMDEAMREAQRLSRLIAEEEARNDKAEVKEQNATTSSSDDFSASTSQGVPTPSSSSAGSDYNANRRPPSTAFSPIQPASAQKSAPELKQPFTSFEQILPNQSPTALSFEAEPTRLKPPPALTLFNANINLFDDSNPGDNSVVRSKPTMDYMIQIEPFSSSFPGWIVVRRYADFETLHEVLRRISVITGTGFNESHPTLPSWRNHTKTSLHGELERYLCDAVKFQPLAESEGMKRFLDKDQGATRSPGGTKGFGWPTPVAFDQMGKSMMDTLTKAPTQVAGGGKAIFGGVTSILGGKRNSIVSQSGTNHSASRSSISLAPTFLEDSYMGNMGSVGVERQSSESTRSIPPPLSRTSSLSQRLPMAAQTHQRGELSVDAKPRQSRSSRSSVNGRPSRESGRSPSVASITSPARLEPPVNLPPPPSEIPDDYDSAKAVSHQPARLDEGMTYSAPGSRRQSQQYPPVAGSVCSIERSPRMSPTDKHPRAPSFDRSTRASSVDKSPKSSSETKAEKPSTKTKNQPPITEQETQMTVELLFAVITELYTLSSAWNIRRTLLNAAKTFLMRPGNPQLEAIRVLIQENVIDSNTSDAGIAAHILKMRENSLSTEEELKKFPAPLNDQEKEELRVKARKLLVERGMPQALTSVMGAAASGEALGKVFDCLQVESVARGLVFGLMLQGLRAIVQ